MYFNLKFPFSQLYPLPLDPPVSIMVLSLNKFDYSIYLMNSVMIFDTSNIVPFNQMSKANAHPNGSLRRLEGLVRHGEFQLFF